MTNELEGRRILVVEDSPLVASAAEDMLQELGCRVVGPTGSMAIARELVQNETFEAALIDINIRGGKVFPIAEELAARGIPFVLTSGYADWTLPEYLQGRPRLTKPYTAESLGVQLTKLFQARAAS